MLLPIAAIIAFFLLSLRTSDITLRIIISIFATAALALPTLILHWSYLFKSNGIVLEAEDSKYTLSVKGRVLKKFIAHDLAYVTVFKRHKKIEHETGIYYGTWYNYFYAELNFKDGDVVRLPCLLFRSLNDVPFKYSIDDQSYPFYVKPSLQVANAKIS